MMKETISLFLALSILALSIPLTAKERKGADLIIQRADGTQVRGELISVKENSLLLLARESGADVTVDVGDISVITIVKKGKAGKGAWMGALIGGGAGAGVAVGIFAIGSTPAHDSAGMIVLLSTAAGAGLGLLIGGLFGWSSGIDKTVQLEGKSELEIQEILEKLRKKAKIRNSQKAGGAK
jgi:hypothetical protein